MGYICALEKISVADHCFFVVTFLEVDVSQIHESVGRHPRGVVTLFYLLQLLCCHRITYSPSIAGGFNLIERKSFLVQVSGLRFPPGLEQKNCASDCDENSKGRQYSNDNPGVLLTPDYDPAAKCYEFIGFLELFSADFSFGQTISSSFKSSLLASRSCSVKPELVISHLSSLIMHSVFCIKCGSSIVTSVSEMTDAKCELRDVK